MSKTVLPKTTLVAWPRTYRLIPSHYPPIDLFERVADPADWEIVTMIEGLTNDRLRDEVGDISLVPPNERVSGPGASLIMAAFTHIGTPTRFSDGSYGVYYASKTLATAIREAAYHRERFMRTTSEPKTTLPMRNYVGSLRCDLHDIRGTRPKVHDPSSYAQSQRLGAAVRTAGGNGVVFDSVRSKGGENIAVFRPKVLAARSGKPHVTQGPHLYLDWDATRVTRYLIVGETTWHAL